MANLIRLPLAPTFSLRRTDRVQGKICREWGGGCLKTSNKKKKASTTSTHNAVKCFMGKQQNAQTMLNIPYTKQSEKFCMPQTKHQCHNVKWLLAHTQTVLILLQRQTHAKEKEE